jgi:hypothetical protein
MYGRLAETQESTEASRKFLYDLVDQLRLGKIKLEQIELIEGGGFKVNPLLDRKDDMAAETDKEI